MMEGGEGEGRERKRGKRKIEGENKVEAEKAREPRKGKKKIAASGLSRCSWNNFDVCMDEGALPPSHSTPSFSDPYHRPGFLFPRCEFGIPHGGYDCRPLARECAS